MSYNTFALFYDRLTENADYKVRSDYISNFFSQYGNGGKRVLDLACGTGTLCSLFNKKGYNVTGVDLSPDMLTVAKAKCPDSQFICADISDFNVDEKFDFCTCTLDSINHLENINAVKKCFMSVYNCLDAGGIFVFDVNTIYKHNEILAENTFVFDEDDFFLSWDNEALGNNRVRILLDFFVFNGKNYDRFSEEFVEIAYSVDDLVSALENFEIIGIYDELSENAHKADSERIYFVCRRK